VIDAKNNRIIVDPIEDALLKAGIKYIEMLDKAPESAKGKQYGLFLELLETRIESGDSFEWPSEGQIPMHTLINRDQVTEGQSVKLVGKIVEQLIARRNARY
jgi:hypothetical protein